MYTERNILKLDPFQTLDKDGVGKLIEMAVKQAKKVNENIKIGVCGGWRCKIYSLFQSLIN